MLLLVYIESHTHKPDDGNGCDGTVHFHTAWAPGKEGGQRVKEACVHVFGAPEGKERGVGGGENVQIWVPDRSPNTLALFSSCNLSWTTDNACILPTGGSAAGNHV